MAGNYEEAIRHYRDALSQDDGMLDVQDVHRRLGGALRKAGRLDEAEAQLREALRLMPSDPHTHLEMATVLEAHGDLEGAASHLERAMAAWKPADESFKPAREARARAGRISSDSGVARDDGHAGLAGMRERAVRVGDSLNVQTVSGKGPTGRAAVPTVGPDSGQW